ncbi:MAG TPA: SGNH/GDSL hydrolase family protein [Vicinamibacteria bacterium]|nr:SGNH/GDSL hydrolase family protein [Vicinamibacteria bacterium]
MNARSPRTLVRAIAGAWLVLAAALVASLAGELWFRIQRHRDYLASERFRATNVFFANGMELNASTHSLWRERWKEYEPGARLDVVAGGERFVVEMNSDGYRTHEIEVPKPKGRVRVVCIGGSTTVAGRTNDETYPALLEKKLRARFPGLDVEVLNLGVSSVTTEYWRGRLDRVLGFEPDVLVQYQAINDIAWRHFPRYAKEHRLRGWAYKSLLLQHLFPFPVEEMDPYLAATLETMGATARACHERGVAYLAGSFASPDPERARGEFRRHLDCSAEFWSRWFPMPSYATWAAIVARHNRLFVDFVQRNHLPYVLVHEKLTDPALFIDVCHFTPEGIDRLAGTFLPGVAELVEDTAAYRSWKRSVPRP